MTIPPNYQPLPGSERPHIAGATLLGPLDASAMLSVTLLIRSRPGSPPLPDLAYWQRTPPGRRTFLSADELARLYGAAQSDLDAVTDFVKSRGMTVVESHPGRCTVIARGTAAQMSAAFGIELNQYQAPVRPNPGSVRTQDKSAAAVAVASTQTHRGFEGSVNLPSALSEIVTAVIGLDNRRVGGRAGTGDPAGAALLTVPQVAAQYHFPTTGAKDQTIGIFAGSPASYLESDIKTKYFPSLPKGFNTPPNLVNISLTVDGTTYANNPSSVSSLTSLNSALANACTELTQDISTSSTIAQGATVNVYFTEDTEDGWIAFLVRAIVPDLGDSPPSVLSASWILAHSDDSGTIGSAGSSGSIANVMSRLFQLATLAGITIFIAAGDWGADDQTVDSKCHTGYPGSDPWVVSCGGTVLGPPSTPITEFTWSDAQNFKSGFGPNSGTSSDFGATGGGVSDNFPVPEYQFAAKISPVSKNDGGVRRGVPDISGMVGLSTFFVNAIPYSFVGTSCVAPLYAGLTAVLNSALGQPIGFLNPTLYSNSSVCNDVTFGNNDSGDSPDSPFYTAGKGWDPCTGLGSVDGTKLLDVLAKVEAEMLIDPDYPFDFGAFWLYCNPGGAQNRGDDVEAGLINGDEDYNDVTTILTTGAKTATFAGLNYQDDEEGGVGIFGRSLATDWSMGVVGQSSKGCGVYGLATDELPDTPPGQKSHGIGVVGRSMGGIEPERISVERIMGEPIGVLGHSTTGIGVRGHSGPLFTPPLKGLPLPPVVNASPGGVFSSGQLQGQAIAATKTQQMSLDSLAQLQLVPSSDTKLPASANIGDFFLAYLPGPVGNDPFGIAQLYLCTHFLLNVPQWQQVQLGAVIAGGKPV